MTKTEFDAWIEQHYEELMKVAYVKTRGYDPAEVLQTAIVGMLNSPALGTTPLALAWPWAVGMVRGMAGTSLRSARRRAGVAWEAENISRASTVGAAGGGTRTPTPPSP